MILQGGVSHWRNNRNWQSNGDRARCAGAKVVFSGRRDAEARNNFCDDS